MEEVIQVSYTGRSPGQWFKWDCVFADGWRYVAVLSVKYAQTQIIWEYEIPGSLEQKGEKKKNSVCLSVYAKAIYRVHLKFQ